MIDYNQIALFIEVIEAGSLSEASRRLNYSKSNLSRALSNLEKSLHTQLVIRNTRNFRPTTAGLDFYRLCKESFSQLRYATENIKEDKNGLKGKLIITAAVDFAHTILPPIATKFLELYPNVELDIRGEDRIVDLVKEGIDLALRFGKLNDSNLKALKICDTSMVLVANPNYLSQQTKIKTLENLSDQIMISFNKKYENHIVLKRRGGKKQKLKINTYMHVNNPLIAKAMVQFGRGIALLPDMICAEELASGKLVRVLPEYSTEESPFHFVWPSHYAESAKVRAFINFSKDMIRNQFTPHANLN